LRIVQTADGINEQFNRITLQGKNTSLRRPGSRFEEENPTLDDANFDYRYEVQTQTFIMPSIRGNLVQFRLNEGRSRFWSDKSQVDENTFQLPSRILLRIHAACCHIACLSGAEEPIDYSHHLDLSAFIVGGWIEHTVFGVRAELGEDGGLTDAVDRRWIISRAKAS